MQLRARSCPGEAGKPLSPVQRPGEQRHQLPERHGRRGVGRRPLGLHQRLGRQPRPSPQRSWTHSPARGHPQPLRLTSGSPSPGSGRPSRLFVTSFRGFRERAAAGEHQEPGKRGHGFAQGGSRRPQHLQRQAPCQITPTTPTGSLGPSIQPVAPEETQLCAASKRRIFLKASGRVLVWECRHP